MKILTIIIMMIRFFQIEASANVCVGEADASRISSLQAVSAWCPSSPTPNESEACALNPENPGGVSGRIITFLPSSTYEGAFHPTCNVYDCVGGHSGGFDSDYPGPICLSSFKPPVTGPVNSGACTSEGSIIEDVNQVVGETIPVIGAPFELVYFSKFARGYKPAYKINLSITGPTVESVVTDIVLTMKDEYGNVLENQIYYSIPNQEYNYEWNGLNSSGVETWGQVYRELTIQENTTLYDNIYGPPHILYLGNFKAKKLGLGGWLPSI